MTALSIHLGLNAVDPAHYDGWSGELAACEHDATDMASIAQAAGFVPTLLLTEAATGDALMGLLARCGTLRAGDRLLITFAGHGSQVPDMNGDEADGADETWVLHDRMVIDDELYSAIRRLQPGVRLILVSDSCHSGTVDRAMTGRIDRSMPAALSAAVYAHHDRTYGRIRSRTAGAGPSDARCEGLLMAACQDNQVALDGDRNGLFTGTLKGIWAGGRFRGSYLDAMRAARAAMPRFQIPNLLTLGSPARRIELDSLFA